MTTEKQKKSTSKENKARTQIKESGAFHHILRCF
ncbi:Uncharacterised protein [uncultured Avibacterium sp.]|uniref:Uncharacterized protein n=1 Tax=uncultured Avibacterium sp. TaxID=1936169 RepID=A0A486XF96_9PAST|nr:Uncharacterised protein [uncultured Avibacterium sp.]